MGRRIRIRGETQEHEEDKTIQQLKHEVGWPKNDVVVYDDGEGTVILSDYDHVKDIPEDATASSQPAEGAAFG